jgi:hypothetical protein
MADNVAATRTIRNVHLLGRNGVVVTVKPCGDRTDGNLPKKSGHQSIGLLHQL